MTGRTHDLAGFSALITVVLFAAIPKMSIATLVVSLLGNQMGALFPDMDQVTSNAWDRFPAGRYFGRIFAPLAGGHRHITHSLLGLALFGLLTFKLSQILGKVILVDMGIVWAAFMIGFVSHLVMDSLTDIGIPLLWPLKWKFGIPPIAALRPTTGTWIEKLIVFPTLLFVDFYLIYSHYDQLVIFFRDTIFR